MDVRCEKCLTVYELDDDKVSPAGLTVKCQECGNLFKVRRKAEPAQALPSDRFGALPGARGDADEVSTDQRALVPAASPAQPEKGWLLRSAATRDIVRFRELTTLQQWIVERKVTREDEISRGGESWKSLGEIAELASFFHVVEQAQSVARASQPGLAVQRANQTGGLGSEQIAALPTQPFAAHRAGAGGAFDADIDDDRPGSPSDREGSSPVLAVVFAVLVVAVAVSAYLAWPHITGGAVTGGGAGESAAQLVAQGREAFLLDTDEGFRKAISLFDRALELDPTATQARLELAETHVTWAAYLLDDERALSARGGGSGTQAAHTLGAEARAHLDRARHVLEEARDQATEGPLLARALADLLRVENAPIASIEPPLDRAGQANPRDRELLYVRGELARREGKTTDALALLSEAATPDAGKKPLVRALYRFAQLALASGNQENAARACAELKPIWSTHDRARILCAPEPVDASTPAPRPDAGPAATEKSIAPPNVPAPPPTKDINAMDYKSLVATGDRLAVGGHSPQARKLYERAVELEPKGLGALVGLGYCDLDAERYMQAVDRFNAALSVDPSSGEAMLGLAESYRVRGQTSRAIDAYRKYLAQHPGGDKAQLAQKNIRELEARLQPVEKPSKSESDSASVADKITIKSQDSVDDEKEVAKDKEPVKEKPEVKLPRPPSEEPAP